ncbi:MAG: hypothetical protein Q6352_015860 [Candidatus Freyrarchaeum guaymaensis]
MLRIIGGKIDLYKTWEVQSTIEKDGRWEPEELEKAMDRLLEGETFIESVGLKEGVERLLGE